MNDALVRLAYDAYSRQDLEQLKVLLSDDVDWPDGTGARLHGKADVAAYWIDQWKRTRTTDRVGIIARLSDSVRAVRIDQVVKNLGGDTISTGTFAHIVHLEGERIIRLDIVQLT